MNVTPFYMLIGIVLAGIFFFFKPLKVDIAETGELAQIELSDFRVYEVVPRGVKVVLAGSSVKRFEDRYQVEEINLTDRSGNHIENMKANRGIYKEPMIYLYDRVRYTRDDGVSFETEQADYNQTSGQINTAGPFVLRQSQDRVTGNDLVYNTESGDLAAKHIEGFYRLKENP